MERKYLSQDDCKNIGILEIERMKKCKDKKKLNTQESTSKKSNRSLGEIVDKTTGDIKSGAEKIKSGSKKILGKIKTDSKLTDFIKKKMGK